MLTAGTLKLDISGGYIAGSTVLWDGNWHHIALLREGTTGRVYYDGNYVTLTDSTLNSGASSHPVSLRLEEPADERLQVRHDQFAVRR